MKNSQLTRAIQFFVKKIENYYAFFGSRAEWSHVMGIMFLNIKQLIVDWLVSIEIRERFTHACFINILKYNNKSLIKSHINIQYYWIVTSKFLNGPRGTYGITFENFTLKSVVKINKTDYIISMIVAKETSSDATLLM